MTEHAGKQQGWLVWFFRWVDSFIPDEWFEAEGELHTVEPEALDQLRRARTLVSFCLMLAFWGPFFGLLFLLIGALPKAFGAVLGGLAVGAIPLMLKRTKSLLLSANVLMVCMVIIVLFLGVRDGGHGSPSFLWNLGIPLVGVLLMGPRVGIVWAIVLMLESAVFFAIYKAGVTWPTLVTPASKQLHLFASGAALLVAIMVLGILYEAAKKEALEHFHQSNLRLNEALEVLARTNNELKEARDEAQQANEAKSNFIANMSHELRTPMNAIIGYAEMWLEEADEVGVEPELGQDLGKIHRAGKQLLELLNDVLDMSKIEAGKIELSLQHVELAPLLSEIEPTIEPLARKNDNQFVIEYQPDVVGVIYADPVRLRQILINLLGNACKFTEGGEVHLEVTEATEQAGVLFHVSDTGIGLTQEQIEQLFKRFSQAEKQTAHQYGGTGLGLSISQRFCQLMGGEITVKSTPGEGTCFTVFLPAK